MRAWLMTSTASAKSHGAIQNAQRPITECIHKVNLLQTLLKLLLLLLLLPSLIFCAVKKGSCTQLTFVSVCTRYVRLLETTWSSLLQVKKRINLAKRGYHNSDKLKKNLDRKKNCVVGTINGCAQSCWKPCWKLIFGFIFSRLAYSAVPFRV